MAGGPEGSFVGWERAVALVLIYEEVVGRAAPPEGRCRYHNEPRRPPLLHSVPARTLPRAETADYEPSPNIVLKVSSGGTCVGPASIVRTILSPKKSLSAA